MRGRGKEADGSECDTAEGDAGSVTLQSELMRDTERVQDTAPYQLVISSLAQGDSGIAQGSPGRSLLKLGTFISNLSGSGISEAQNDYSKKGLQQLQVS